MNGDDRQLGRRRWLLDSARALVLAGLGFLAAYLVGRRATNACVRFTLPCRDCRLLAACELPRARDVKENTTERRRATMESKG